MTIRVLIADDEPLMVRALGSVLSTDPALEVVATAGDAEEAVRLAEAHRPEVALLDVRMPRGGGTEAARRIRARAPGVRILALSAHEDRATVVEMLRAGAHGYVVKGSPADEIVEHVRRIARGDPGFSAEATARAMDELTERLQTEEERAKLRREQIRQIRAVLEGRGLETAFQPVADLLSGTTLGFEALARFRAEPLRGPDVWFAEAAGVGMGAELEVAAIRKALSGLGLIPAGAFLSVNVSPETATARSFLEVLSLVPVDRVVIEITEHARVDDYEALSGALADLRRRGLRLAVDDAGAGFASLRHILRLEPDFIKLDVTITREINARPAYALATALHSFAIEIGATIIAEGIETEEELATLRRLGIGCGQGYYLGRPGPLPAPGQAATLRDEGGLVS